MKLARAVHYELAIGFGCVAAGIAHMAAPPDADPYTLSMVVVGCAVFVAIATRRLRRWLLTDSPSLITRRDMTCRCGRLRLRDVVVMDQDDVARTQRLLCARCDVCDRGGALFEGGLT